MKIISKYKDYYDYLKGIYGEDPKLILDRTKFTTTFMPPVLEEEPDTIEIFVGYKMYRGLYTNKGVLWGKEASEFKDRLNRRDPKYKPWRSFNEDSFDKYITTYKRKQDCPTWKQKCPILIKNGRDYLPHPILKDYNMQKILSPKDIWIELSEFLGDMNTLNEKEVPIGDDNLRLEAHGFDKKTSFRKIK